MDYAKAISSAVILAGYAADGVKYLVNHPEKVTEHLDKMSKMLNSAKKLMTAAGDMVHIDELLVKAAEEGIVEADAADTEEGGEVVRTPRPQPKAPAFLKVAAGKIADFRDDTKAEFERRKLAQEMLKAVHDSKQKILEGANLKLPITKLVKQLSSDNPADRVASMGILDASGCFAIARYGKIEIGKDLAGYSGIYVGKAECVGDGIAKAISPNGNADVYADIKYKQNVYVYVFSCVPDKLDEKFEALVQLLEAGESYNRAELAGDVEVEGVGEE